MTVFSAVKELLNFSDITKPLYTHHQADNIAYIIMNRIGKFASAIREWDCIPTVQKTWVGFKQFFRMAHHKL